MQLEDRPFPTIYTNLATSQSRVIAPAVVATWCWQPASKLPTPKNPKHWNPELRPFYRTHLAGHPALEALDAIAAAL